MSEKPPGVPTPVDFFNWLNQYMQPAMEAGAKSASGVPTPQGGDPFSLWRNFYEANEKGWTEFMQQTVDKPEFAALLGRTASQQAAWRDNVRKASQSYLEAANMPTREDISRIAGLVVALDAKLDDMQDQILELQDKLDKSLRQHSATGTASSTDLPNTENTEDTIETSGSGQALNAALDTPTSVAEEEGI